MFQMFVGFIVVFINITAFFSLLLNRKYLFSLLLFLLFISHQYIGFLGIWGAENSLIFLYYVLLIISIIVSMFGFKIAFIKTKEIQ